MMLKLKKSYFLVKMFSLSKYFLQNFLVIKNIDCCFLILISKIIELS